MLTVTCQFLIAFAAFLLENEHLLSFTAVIEDSSLHNCSFDIRRTDFYISVGIDKEHFAELYCRAFFSGKAIHKNFHASLYLKLLACNVYNCVHFEKL